MVWTCSQGDTETPLFLHANPPLLLPPPVLGPTEGALPPCSQSACVFFFFLGLAQLCPLPPTMWPHRGSPSHCSCMLPIY